MAQIPYSTGQTAYTIGQFVTRVQQDNSALAVGSPDFLGAMQLTLANYALTGYKGNYYIKPVQGEAPTIFPSAESVGTNGSFFEIPFPSDAQDTGILDVEVLYSTGTPPVLTVPQAMLILNPNESGAGATGWDTTNTNSNKIYWRMAGRNVRLYVPTMYTTAGTPYYAFGYRRFPTYPGTLGDILDAPAEDILNLYKIWKGNIIADNRGVPALQHLTVTGAPALTGSVNNWALNFASQVFLLTSNGAYDITGIAAGTTGTVMILRNISLHDLTLKANDSSSLSANQFAMSGDVILGTGDSQGFIYDGTSGNWFIPSF